MLNKLNKNTKNVNLIGLNSQLRDSLMLIN